MLKIEKFFRSRIEEAIKIVSKEFGWKKILEENNN
jgi:hypothetical protein